MRTQKKPLLQVTLADWLPKDTIALPEFIIPLWDAKILPCSDEEWPGEEKSVCYWVNVMKDGKEYAVGYRATFGGAKFYLYTY